MLICNKLIIEDIRVGNVFILSMPINRGNKYPVYYHDILYHVIEKKNTDTLVIKNEQFEDYRQVKIDKIKMASISDYIGQLNYPQIAGTPIFMAENENDVRDFEFDKYDLGYNLTIESRANNYWEIQNGAEIHQQIQFLHELQNLFYESTNSELEINIEMDL